MFDELDLRYLVAACRCAANVSSNEGDDMRRDIYLELARRCELQWEKLNADELVIDKWRTK
jgi:hypothetical protein